MKIRIRKSIKIAGGLLLIASISYYFSLPTTLFSDPYSTVAQAAGGELLSASIATDGQWRFPESDSLPEKFIQALITYEDKRFYHHIGVDYKAFSRALRDNIQKRKIVSGGSTITMQVIRLSRKNQSRSIWEKLIEIVLATRLEWRYNKSEILNLYASHAPFGGNVVGLEAACWRYFGRSMKELSWGEAALLAVLPNAPSLIHPGKNRNSLLQKRNALLNRLQDNGTIDAFTCQLAKEESIPEKPQPLPRHARHLLQRMATDGLAQQKLQTTIDYRKQQLLEQQVQDHYKLQRSNQIHNAAALILDVRTGNVIAYVGNVFDEQNGYHGNEVDIIAAPRSTGSILKPFLYAAMLDEGKILPTSLLPDVPTFINGFAPKNFTKEYDGIVHADKALTRSLNVPAVHLLREYRYEKFHTLLKGMGMKTLNQPADHYGLSLILGGAEGTLWDITGMYASMGRNLLNFFERPGANKYTPSDIHPPVYHISDSVPPVNYEANTLVSAAATFQTWNVLTEVYRPGEETGWRYFNSSKKIAWKTGTSYGFRDAWAVGITPEYVVGVWVGNADGEGRPGLTGTEAAAPLLFNIFSQLPPTTWFRQPTSEMVRTAVCSASGYRPTELCQQRDTIWAVKASLTGAPCRFHQRVHLSVDGKYRVNSQCASLASMKSESWFILPPVQEYYYKAKTISYKVLPPLKDGCRGELQIMDLIYPKQGARIFIPRALDGTPGQVVLELAHSRREETVYWHLDNTFLGSTKGIHQMAINPEKGMHVLTLVDGSGQSLVRTFEILSNM